MGFVVLTGNGVNLLDENVAKYCSTLNLLNAISNEYHLKLSSEYLDYVNKGKGFSINCESLLNGVPDKGDEYQKVIAKELRKTPSDCPHRKEILTSIYNLKPDAYITTNYDLGFEKSNKMKMNRMKLINKHKKYKGTSKSYEGLNIYHIHGDVYKDGSKLCLGFQNYIKFMGKFFNDLISMKDTTMSKLSLDDIKKKMFNAFREMLDKDTFIFGFSLDSSEIDFWYFLTLRAKLISKYGIEKFGKIYFYVPDDGNNKVKQLQTLFNLYYVNVISFESNKPHLKRSAKTKFDYFNFYQCVFKDIKNRLS